MSIVEGSRDLLSRYHVTSLINGIVRSRYAQSIESASFATDTTLSVSSVVGVTIDLVLNGIGVPKVFFR